MKSERESSTLDRAPDDELDNMAPIYNPISGDADQAQEDDNEFGDGDVDMDGGGIDDD